MKTARFLFMIAGVGVLTLGVSYAGQPSGQGPGENQTAGDHPASHTDGSPGHDNKKQTDGKHSKSKDNNQVSKKSGKTGNQTTSNKPAGNTDSNAEHANSGPADTVHSQMSNNSHASEENIHGRPVKTVVPAHHSKQVVTNHWNANGKPADNSQSKLPVANDFHQPVLNQPSTVIAKNGLMTNKLVNPQEEPARRLPTGGGAAVLFPGIVRSRGATTAALGQLSPSSAKTSAAVINGTGMKHKP